MDLTPEHKAYIDGLSYIGILSRWRFAPIGDQWFHGKTGTYWTERMKKLREKMTPGELVSASKSVGLDR